MSNKHTPEVISPSKRFTVQFEVDGVWIDDGFNLTDELAHEMLWNVLQFAHEHELKAKVVNVKEIAKAQGGAS